VKEEKMVLFNYGNKEITAKIVYYGPGLGGKTTNLQYIHSKMNADTRGKLLSLATDTDRTLFFDFLPVNLGKIRGFTVRFQLYTVPGQVYYNATRKLVLKGADAVVFVADSQVEMMEKNLESLENMKENLVINGMDPETMPLVLQYNKQDLPNLMDLEELNRRLNHRHVPFYASVAVTGEGVLPTFKMITKELMLNLRKKHDIQEFQESESEVEKPSSADEAPVISEHDPRADPAEKQTAGDLQAASTPSFKDKEISEIGGDRLAGTVHEIQKQIKNIEEQLHTLLFKDEMIQKLLEQINVKLESQKTEKAEYPAGTEEPLVLKDHEKKKRGLFWNRFR